ncbi:hypothetical protein KYK29_00455 [Shinella daejeonensis]|uniref:hypothetical protein n=1 Tax=Shinella daejeonensis TaxID=659017 RepID=UPI0020C75514|nr:hypothetical protein [Shinella daejeonensis]MCP8893382.1 hypothetical protein [Shinella daejeonensis]
MPFRRVEGRAKLSSGKIRVCVIGNSHVACVKRAWDDIRHEQPGVELTFFAARGRALQFLEVAGRVLAAGDERLRENLVFTSGGRAEIDPEEYDFFLLFGLGFQLPGIASFTSSAAASQASAGSFDRSLNCKIAGLLRQVTDKDIFIGHNPQWAKNAEKAYHEGVYDIAFGLVRSAVRERGFTLVRQPAQTIVDGWFTEPALSAGSLRLDVSGKVAGEAHRQKDVSHMNVTFGKIWLTEFLRLHATRPTAITADVLP